MKIPSSSHIHMLSYLVVLLLLPLISFSADPDSLQDFCVADQSASSISVNGFPCKPASEVTSDDFFFDGLSKVGDTSNIFGSNVTGGNVLTFPALNTLGISMNRVDFAPGGVNPPHSHPRATESGVVIEGKLLVGFVTTGNMFVIPRGLVHSQKNVGVGKALVIAAFNSQLPGAVVLPFTLFASTPSIPDDVLTRAFQVEEKVVKSIKSKFSS
ncbi:hypothetical protein CIPAW_12G021200 [Carya illinoinensis]|uniref:Cupin type-1 domain-containing protein n=1 Tax=Carya illinoinensis TaxID=32201 RepID=A0A8T1NM10_CARIL|nr:hypothetical protein CIPAW_12G021200 [Carya illinoinensis]